MKTPNEAARVHFTGCGGAGMVGLALIDLKRGRTVSGSDLKDSHNVELLRQRGAKVAIGHAAAHLRLGGAPPDLLVYSSAVKQDNPELAAARALGVPTMRRGEYLGVVAASCRRSVAVGGSHGKTTVTAMVVHILRSLGRDPGFMIGGSPVGMEIPADAGDGDIFVTEADESDLSMLHLTPTVAVVTNVEDDHCWSTGGRDALYAGFARFASQAGELVYGQSEVADAVFGQVGKKTAIRLDERTTACFRSVKQWGGFQRDDAVLAVEACLRLGVDRDEAVEAAKSFPGVKRRMRELLDHDGVTLMEDYAHHPTELRASLAALRERFPGKWLRVVFQPHRYARLERYLTEFAAVLATADAVVVAPVFAAWTETGKVESADLAAAVGPKARATRLSWPELAAELAASCQPPEVLAVLGAGDVDELLPELQRLIRQR